jgi:UDP-N-acetylglucosamine--N-acetylmuramyl-(pentapeptide) pyrophosphoryl-undecaprenol N-acetylglucosamine transferase
MSFAIAAAGTGGHVYPALSVAAALAERGVPASEILFLGGTRFEAEVVPAAGYQFVGFELTKLRRSLSPENLRIPVVVRRTASAMAAELRRVGARVVLGMSGYVTVPAAMAARRAAVPFVLQEQNASPGLAARYAARRADVTFLGLPGRSESLPRSEVVGNPLRRQIAGFERSGLRGIGRERYGVAGSGPVLGVLGGSLGARVLNESVGRIAKTVRPDSIIHLTGRDAHDHFESLARQQSETRWVTRAFEREMEYFYASVDLVVCRAGAMTVSELAATGTPAILVPLARVGQTWNARALTDAGAAELVEEGDIGSLPTRVDALLRNEAGRAAMAAAARAEARPQAAGRIADHLLEVAHG